MALNTEKTVRLVGTLIGVVLTVLLGTLALSRLGWPVVSLSYDLPFYAHSAGQPQDICLVYLEDAEEKVLDRAVQAELLGKLDAAGTRAVVYDILFTKPRAEVDEKFAEAILQFRGVDVDGNPLPGRRQRHVFMGWGRETDEVAGMNREQLLPPTDLLWDAISFPDTPMLTAYDEDVYFARKLTTKTAEEVTLCWGVAAGLRPEWQGEEAPEGLWINFAGPPGKEGEVGTRASVPTYFASDILEGRVADPLLEDKIVFIGGKPGIVGEALGIDLFASPHRRLNSKVPYMSGVELQATMAANLLQENWLTKTSARTDQIMVVVAGLLLGILFTRLRPLVSTVVAVVLIVALFVGGVCLVHFERVWFPWSVVALVQIPGALLWGTGSHVYIERLFRRRLEEVFGSYVSPEMLDKLAATGFSAALGGEKSEIAVMFTDLANFTTACEEEGDPESVVTKLNDYFEQTSEEIFGQNGTVIKYIGDAIVAAWGVPMPQDDEAGKAARAALGLQDNARIDLGGEERATRIGLHFGEVLAGNIGSSRHIEYTIIGDAVNLAARLEGMNKILGTKILMSEDCASRLGEGYLLRRVGAFKVKGRKGATAIFELLGLEEEGEPEWTEVYAGALERWEKGDLAGARKMFNEVDQARPDGDGPSRFFLGALERGVEPENGVIEMTEK